ncbi:hypothetical protein KR009_001928 [Drosophila setifemur]|nr:hypothetical protein KR009_001928 [Drosophila setifemur]
MQPILHLVLLLGLIYATIAASDTFQNINIGGWRDSAHNSETDELLKNLERWGNSGNDRDNLGRDTLGNGGNDRNNLGRDTLGNSGFDTDRSGDDSDENIKSGFQLIQFG